MIIKGQSRAVAAEVATHLRKVDDNERVVEQAPRGTVAQDLLGALREMEAMAAGTRCKKPLYHAKINPEPGERMTPERWERAVEALEQKLGLESHARVVVMHLKKGREHAHVVWGRIDPDTQRAWHDGHNFTKHEECARELEAEFGHRRVQGAHVGRDGERPARALRDEVTQQASRVGADVREVQAKLVEAWQRSDTGQAFAQAVEDAGYMLARGDRRAFVVVYPGTKKPGYVALGARVLGVPAAVVRERLADIDPAALPSIDAATTAMRERAGLEAAPTPERSPVYDREAEEARRIGRELDGSDEAGRLKAAAQASETKTQYQPRPEAKPSGRERQAKDDGRTVSRDRDPVVPVPKPVSPQSIAIATDIAGKAGRGVAGALELVTKVFTELVTDLGKHAEAPPIPPEATDPKSVQDNSKPQDRPGNTLTRLEADDVQAKALLQTSPLSLAHDLAERMRRAEEEARQARERARAAGRGRGGRDDDGRER